VAARVGFIEFNRRGGHGQVPAAGHRIASVHDQVEDHLLELARVGLDSGDAGVETEVAVDVFADQARDHLADFRAASG